MEDSAEDSVHKEDRPMTRMLDGLNDSEFVEGNYMDSSQGNLTNSFGAKKTPQDNFATKTMNNRSRPRLIWVILQAIDLKVRATEDWLNILFNEKDSP